MTPSATLLASASQACTELAREIEARQIATSQEIANCIPGGSENPTTSGNAWLAAVVMLRRLLTRDTPLSGRAFEEAEDRDAALIVSLLDQPVILTLSADTENASRFAIHPKSWDALLVVDDCVRRIRSWEEDLESSRSLPLGAWEPVAKVCADGMKEEYRIVAWIGTHPSPRLPFDSRDSISVIPAWTAKIRLDDLRMFGQALFAANGGRVIRIFPEALPPVAESEVATDGSPPIGWDRFLALRSREFGVTEQELQSNYSIASLAAVAAMSRELAANINPMSFGLTS
ncbi:MAG: hypothetical protein H0W30_01250 [Gemmatimonadaceae bacterium]|nr:hypothetical protein [Gemmatimonadaceae bacterium]MBA3557202.1 hypothetical protein [Gemmatimonadaceae bacterium]